MNKDTISLMVKLVLHCQAPQNGSDAFGENIKSETEFGNARSACSGIFVFNMDLMVSCGGAEMLFDKQKSHHITLPEQSTPWKLKDLLPWIRDNLLKERPELFMQGNSVRPGILVLVNDADWELMGELEYEIQQKDQILFISTLHGG